MERSENEQRAIDIANEILAQLGGNEFVAMTGAKNFMALGEGLQFKIGKNGSRTNCVRIKLMPSDTYNMEFLKVPQLTNAKLLKYSYEELQEKLKPTVVKAYEDVYCDQLRELFTSVTGLETRMPRLIFN